MGDGGEERLGRPGEMRAVLLSAFGGLGKLCVSRRATPEPRQGELKIRVKACGLNFLDLMVRQGNIDSPPKTPLIPGFECSGIVEDVGPNTTGFEIGERVMALVNYGAWAEVVCTSLDFVYKIPDAMSFPEAAAFLVSFVAAYMMLFEVANLQEGMSVLVHSAGGGVGQAVAQLCSCVPGVTVFGTASLSKHEAIKDSVTYLFDRNIDYVQEVKKVSPEGVDIVLDCLCGEDTGKGLVLLKPLGTYILYGLSNMVTGETKSFFSTAKTWWQVEKVNPIKLYEENKVMAGFSLLNLLFRQGRANLVAVVVQKLLSLYNEKKIRPVVDSLWALEELWPMLNSTGCQNLPTQKKKDIKISDCVGFWDRLVSHPHYGGIAYALDCCKPEQDLRLKIMDRCVGEEMDVKEAMQRIHDRGNIGKLILDVEKSPTPLMANDSTETSEAGEDEEEQEDDDDNKERVPFLQ